MGFPFIVVDQKQTRRFDSIGFLLDRYSRENLQILIPDVAGFEFSRCKDPHQTWRRCLRHLAPDPELIVVGKRLSRLCQDEIASGRPSEDLVERRATEIFRAMLRKLAEGDGSDLISLIAGPVRKLVPASLAVWSEHDQIKAHMRLI